VTGLIEDQLENGPMISETGASTRCQRLSIWRPTEMNEGGSLPSMAHTGHEFKHRNEEDPSGSRKQLTKSNSPAKRSFNQCVYVCVRVCEFIRQFNILAWDRRQPSAKDWSV